MKKIEQKFVVVTRKTRLENLVHKYNTVDQAKFYIEHMGIDFDDYLLEDKNYQSVLKQALDITSTKGKVIHLNREFLPNYIFDPTDILIVIGQDGLVANTLKYLDNQKVIAINPDTNRWDGVLLPFTIESLDTIIDETLSNKRPVKEITMAQATLNDGQTIYGVNDLFIGRRTHVSSRYQLQIDQLKENQSSSGIIISTGLGSTGWLKSIIKGAKEIIESYTDINLSSVSPNSGMNWNDDYLYYSVREPFASRSTGSHLVFGKITQKNTFTIESQMPYSGCIFSDGIEADYLEFNSGSKVTITIADKKGHLVI